VSVQLEPTCTAVPRLDVRKRTPPSPPSPPASKKGRISDEDGINVADSILEGFETEISCPMCVIYSTFLQTIAQKLACSCFDVL